MLTGLGLYALSDAIIKQLTTLYSVQQISFLRAFTRVIPLLIAIPFQGGFIQVLGTKHPARHLIRLVVNFFYTYSFMYALKHGSLTTVYTFGYTAPFFMIMLSLVILKENTSYEKWVAVGIGLLGVIIAMNPTSDVFEIAAIYVLIGSFLGSLNKILMRRLAATEHTLAIAIYPNIMMIIVTFPILLYYNSWGPMPWKHWGSFAIMGALAATGQYAIAQSLRFAQGSTLAPIDYSTYFWVVMLDYFLWHIHPNRAKIIGAAIIVSSNLFILYRTRKEKSLLKYKIK
jgi:drug/metabolite transporter (DMT)-like permease